MTDPRPERDHAARYEIRCATHLDHRWDAWFDGLVLRHDRDGTTTLSGPVVDQAALYGLLDKLRDLGLPLLSVRPVPVAPDRSGPRAP